MAHLLRAFDRSKEENKILDSSVLFGPPQLSEESLEFIYFLKHQSIPLALLHDLKFLFVVPYHKFRCKMSITETVEFFAADSLYDV